MSIWERIGWGVAAWALIALLAAWAWYRIRRRAR